MTDEPIPNFQCPSCGSMSIIERQKEVASKSSFFSGTETTISHTLICLKCKWEYQKGQTINYGKSLFR